MRSSKTPLTRMEMFPKATVVSGNDPNIKILMFMANIILVYANGAIKPISAQDISLIMI